MKVTSAYANKLIRQYTDDKEYWQNKEINSCVYTAAINEEPVIPEYDFEEVSGKIAELDRKIRTIKHAINLANANAVIEAEGDKLSVDEILVEMTQLNKRKAVLDVMRKREPKMRKESYLSSRLAQPEYEYINYDLEVVKEEFERVSARILNLQMALDKYNQTFEFEIEL